VLQSTDKVVCVEIIR